MKKEVTTMKPLYPMRINKYLAHKGYATRREADELIAKKKVLVNGAVAVLGDKMSEEDVVEVIRSGKPKQHLYFAYNKPKGVITHSPQGGEEDIQARTEKFPDLQGVFPVGRLDKASRGLIILTNDGRVTDRLLNPEHLHDKEYIVIVRERLRDSFKKNMEGGLTIDDYITKPCSIDVIDDTTFKITLTEGKKHQIRRMVEALHNNTTDLARIRIMNIELGDLAPGGYRAIKGDELVVFLKALGL